MSQLQNDPKSLTPSKEYKELKYDIEEWLTLVLFLKFKYNQQRISRTNKKWNNIFSLFVLFRTNLDYKVFMSGICLTGRSVVEYNKPEKVAITYYYAPTVF